MANHMPRTKTWRAVVLIASLVVLTQAEIIDFSQWEVTNGDLLSRVGVDTSNYRDMIVLDDYVAPPRNTPCGLDAVSRVNALLSTGDYPIDRADFDASGIAHASSTELARLLISSGLASPVDGDSRFAAEAAAAKSSGAGCIYIPVDNTEIVESTIGLEGGLNPVSPVADVSVNVSARQTVVGRFPTGFTYTQYLSYPDLATDFRFLPGGRIVILQKSGLILFAQGTKVLTTPFADLRAIVNDYFDRGCMGITPSLNFQSDPQLWVFCTYENDPRPAAYESPKTGRIIRIRANGNREAANGRTTVIGSYVGAGCFDATANSDCIPQESRSHAGGGLFLRSDGLYVSVGDSVQATFDQPAYRAQLLGTYHGKLLRIHPTTGLAVSGNPYFKAGVSASSRNAKIWAIGVRNPLTLRAGRAPGTILYGDVGWDTVEKISQARSGGNMGWPCYEGNLQTQYYSSRPECKTLKGRIVPAITWLHNGKTSAAMVGDYINFPNWPPSYRDVVVYSDMAQRWIGFARLSVSPPNALVTDFTRVSVEGTPIQSRVGPNNALYVLEVRENRIMRLSYSGSAGGGLLTVTSFRPARGATVSASGLTVAATLSDQLRKSSTANGLQLRRGGARIPARVVLQNGDTLILTPSAKLTAGTYTATLPTSAAGGAVDINGKGLAAAFSWTFKVSRGADSTPPRVTSVVPTGAVALDTSFTIRFSEAILQSTIASSINLYELVNGKRGRLVDSSKSYDSGSNAVVLNPTFNLQAGAAYRLRVRNTIKDVSGNKATYTRAFDVKGVSGSVRASIQFPTEGRVIGIGGTISFAGQCTTASGTRLPDSGMAWDYVIRHCVSGSNCHEHRVYRFTGVRSGSVKAIAHEGSYYYIIELTCTYSSGTAVATRRVDHR